MQLIDAISVVTSMTELFTSTLYTSAMIALILPCERETDDGWGCLAQQARLELLHSLITGSELVQGVGDKNRAAGPLPDFCGILLSSSLSQIL